MSRLSFALATILAVIAVDVLAAEDPVVLKGHFKWNKQGDKKYDLKATLTPTGNNEWSVVFDFTWDNQPRQYRGEAKGSLVRGPFEGTASTDGGKRRWIYSGKTTTGTLRFKHTQVMRGGKEQNRQTGTFA